MRSLVGCEPASGRGERALRAPSPASRRRRNHTIASLAALLLLALATAASAHHGEPATGEDELGTLGAENTGGTLSTDTYLTPVPKGDGAEKAGWQQVAGSRWQADGDITRMAEPAPGVPSPTPYDLDFYGLGFLKTSVAQNAGLSAEDAERAAKSTGFAVGAQCRRDPENPSQPVPPEEVSGCKRIPVIYSRLRDDLEGIDTWVESYRADDATDPGGFVAAVAWLGPDRALAVGGTRTYPRREAERPAGDSDDAYAQRDTAEGAGMARVWLYEKGAWRELSNEPDPPGGFSGEDGDEIPDQMRALQAIDVSPRPADCGPTVTSECAIAGGMRQLWHFADGRFVRGYGPGLANSGPMTNAADFRFRVRDVRFVEGASPPKTYAMAVTSGCCAPDRTGDFPALLHFGARASCPTGSGTCWQVTALNNATFLGNVNVQANRAAGLVPDSFYSLTVGGNIVTQGLGASRSAVMAPGGPSEHYLPREPNSSFTGNNLALRSPDATTKLSSLRLVSADGDLQPRDGLADWAVGVLRSSGQGVAFDANNQRSGLSTSSECPNSDALAPGVSLDPNQGPCTLEGYQGKNASTGTYALGSYALNAYRVAGEGTDPGVGWAVGDHGAIATRSPGVTVTGGNPARSGAKSKPVPLPRGEAFEAHRATVTDEPGTVPALAPGTVPTEPAFADGQAVGNPIDLTGFARHIVMSRDGREGWALNSKLASPAYHYDGVRWARCDAGPNPADPACAGAPVRANALARVPLERDSDPTNDERFEAVALTDSGLYRYREDSWSLEDGAPSGTDVAFTAPDDGWVAKFSSGGQFRAVVKLFHFDGERWASCTPDSGDAPADCGDPDKRLRIRAPCDASGALGLAAAAERVYLFSVRDAGPSPVSDINCAGTSAEPYPLILYRDTDERCERSGDPGCWRGGRDATADGTYNPNDGGWDPGCVSGFSSTCVPTAEPGDQSHQGRVDALSVAQDAGGSFQGWAFGAFGSTDKNSAALMMRLSADTQAWRPWTVPDAAADYLRAGGASVGPGQQLTLPSEAGQRNAFVVVSGVGASTTFWGPGAQGRVPALAFDQERRRWTAIPTPWSASPPTRDLARTAGEVNAIAPDGQGGYWAAVLGVDSGTGAPVATSFYHYTDRAPAPVFSETPDPTAGRTRITALGAGADGTVWLGDDAGGVYRYDRLAGWSARVPIPEWDPDRTTRRAPVSAIAVGPDGEGVAVGPGGRIADLGEQVKLDPAATIACDPQAIVPPCGRGNHLHAVAIAPDGSAIVAGADRTLLWRPAGGEFRSIGGPPVRLTTLIADVEMPRPDRAYLLTPGGPRVIRGEMTAPGVWKWSFEIGDSEGRADPLTAGAGISDIAIDAEGHGYAVGGPLLERTGDSESPWRRIPGPGGVIALPAGGGEGALVGGEGGRIHTLIRGRFEVARHIEPFDPLGGDIVAVALTPGYASGEVEAWALLQGSVHTAIGGRQLWKTQSLLHHPADFDDSRLSPSRGLSALPDASPSTPGEISFAAFGKQECDATRRDFVFLNFVGGGQSAVRDTCGPPDGSNITADLINRRIREELTAHPAGEASPQFALFTGDAVDGPGGRPTLGGRPVGHERTPLDSNLKHRRWVELVANPLAEQGVATFGAIGGQDLARNAETCASSSAVQVFTGSSCITPSQAGPEQLGVQPGLNLPWRTAMASLPAPWEGEQEAGGLRFERVGTGALSQRGPELKAGEYELDSGDTHYAVDVIDEATDEQVARIVVVDTSMRSLAASDPLQNPIEAGGQLRWLEEVLCFEGSAEDTDGDVRDCTREPGQQAIVLSNTPTYSYGPISPDETQTDAAAFEAILLKNQVNVVVSGRLGWNGRYWAVAPGVHAPCPGQEYRSDSEAPSISRPEICGASGVGGTQGVVPDPGELIQGLPEDAKQAAGLAGRGAIPFVVSSTAGGHFNTKAERGGFATAESGFWRGYSIVRLSPDGDPAKTIVEQRPILDWVGLSANDPSVPPGERLQLQSFAREAFGMDTAPRYYEIPETQVITHRYHLLLADPGEPWRACEAGDSECEAYYSKLAEGSRSFDSAQDDNSGASASGSGSAQDDKCSPYLCLPERVGTIDPDTGDVRAGNGKYPDTFAIATLSVGEHVAAQPLVFTKSPSFIVNPAGSLAEVPPPPTETGSASAPPPPPGSPTPPIPQPSIPTPPPVPPIAPPQTAEPPEPQPPSPPVPPPPSEAPAPISLTLAPPGITVATPTAVIQPPTPPVNPAPPGGARREARQRQAAAQKSGADGAEHEIQEGGGDLAQGGDQVGGTRAAMTRRDRTRPEPSFTAIARADQPSAWAQGALFTGSITLMSLALALTWTRGRPTPRRRQPVVPAPAVSWAEARHRS